MEKGEEAKAAIRSAKQDLAQDPNLLNQLLGNLSPFCVALGIEAISAKEGTAHMRMAYRDDLVGDPESGVIHGGPMSTLLDTSCGLAVLTAKGAGDVTATIDLRIAYMRPATKGHVIKSRADVFNMTRSVAFVRAIAWDTDENKPVAMATGSFTNSPKQALEGDQT